MRMRRLALLLVPPLLLIGCQLHINIGGDDDDDENGGTGRLTLRIVGSEGGGFNQVGLSTFGVRLRHTDGTTRSFQFDERQTRLFSGEDGELLLDGENVPSGTYDQIRVEARGNTIEVISFVDDGLGGGTFPLGIAGNRVDFPVSFSMPRSSAAVTLVVHTAAAVQFIPDAEFGRDHFLMQRAGYAVRHDRSGRIDGSIPNVCTSGRLDDRAVYIFREDADALTEILGDAGGVNEPVVSFAADSSLNFVSPRLPEGEWQISYTCQALDDDPDEANVAVREELRNNVRPVTVERDLTVTVNFD